MATFADILLADGSATPENHIFKTKTSSGRVATWEDRVNGIPVGYNKLIVETKDNDVVRRVKLSLAVPTLEAVSGANSSGFTPAATVAYVHRVNVEFMLPQRGIAQNRKDILAYIKSALSDTTLAAIITDGDEIAG